MDQNTLQAMLRETVAEFLQIRSAPTGLSCNNLWPGGGGDSPGPGREVLPQLPSTLRPPPGGRGGQPQATF